MLEINVKTIDGQNRSYSVPEDYSVRQFKEEITSSLNIPVDRQRLIFQGRELKDNNQLNEFGVNGKTLHLVQRVPPSTDTPPPAPSSTTTTTTPNETPATGTGGHFGNQDVQRLVQQLIGGLGGGGGQSSVTTSENGMEVHIDVNNISHQANENEIRARIRNIRRFLTLAQSRLNRLQEIQSGAPLEDTAGSILIGSIHGTAQLSDASGTLGTFGFDIPNLNYGGSNQMMGMNLQNLLASAVGTGTGASTAPVVTTPSATPSTPSTPIPTLTATATSGATPEVPTSPVASTNNQRPEQVPTPATTNEAPPTPERAAQTETPTQNTSVEVLSDVIQSVMTSYATFLPYLQQYHEMLVNDENEPPESPTTTTPTTVPGTQANATTPAPTPTPTPSSNFNVINSNNANIIVLGGGGDNNRRQRFCNNINDMMHLLGHLFHNLSDLHINIRDRPPRQMHTMNSMQHTASAIISSRPIGTPATPTNRPATQTQPPANTNPYVRPATNRPATQAQPPANTQQRMPTPTPTPTTPYVSPHVRPVFSQAPQRPTLRATTAQRTPNAAVLSAHQQMHEAALAAARAGTIPGLGSMRMGPRAQQARAPGTPSSSAPVTSYDPFLPCNSVHFYNTVNPVNVAAQIQQQPIGMSQRRRHPAGDQTNSNVAGSGGGGGLANSQGQSASVGLESQGDIGRLISNVLSQIGAGGGGGGVAGQQVQVNIGEMPGQISIGTLSTEPQTAGSPMFNIEQLLGGLASGAVRTQQHPTTTSTTTSTTTTTNPPPQQDPASATVNSLIREAISLMDSDNSDQRLNQPLTSLLNMSFDDEDMEGWRPDSNVPPTSTLSIFNVLFSSMTTGDMINLARGTSRNSVFERSRQPLRDHIKRYFLTPESTSTENALTDENMSNLIDRVYTEVFIDPNGLNIELSQFRLSDQNIDFPKSFEKLMKAHLKIMLTHVYDQTYDEAGDSPETWSTFLFRKFHAMIEAIVMLTRFSITNADVQFTQVVTGKLRQAVVSQSMVSSPVFINIFDNFIQTQVQQTLTGIRSDVSGLDSKEFVVYKKEAVVVVGNGAAGTSGSVLNSVEDEEIFDDAESSLSSMDIDSSFNDYKKKNPAETVAKPNSVPVTESSNNTTNQVEASSTSVQVPKQTSWRNTLPKEWLSEIERDIHTQSSTSNLDRPPFSDAYCSAMPAKRRKVFTVRSDLQDKQIFKKVLGRTLDRTQLKKDVSVENLVEDSMGSSGLIEGFVSEFNGAITDRLKEDKDFNEVVVDLDAEKMEKKDAENGGGKERFSNSRKRFK